MNNFLTRTLTGAIFVALMVGGILWSKWTCIGLFSLIAILGLWEFYMLIEQKGPATPLRAAKKIPGLMLGIIVLAASAGKYFAEMNIHFPFPSVYFAILLFPLYLVFNLFKDKHPTPPFREKPQVASAAQGLSPTLFGILFSVMPFCYLILFYSTEGWYNSEIILGFFLLIWSNDTFAYLVGRVIGKTKLFERISPKKTWEGTIGGATCTQGIAYLISNYFPNLEPIHWHAIALIVSVFGTLGDLVESKLKRSLDVKDSGTILPGHGGILDRFDGVLIAAPFVVCYLIYIR